MVARFNARARTKSWFGWLLITCCNWLVLFNFNFWNTIYVFKKKKFNLGRRSNFLKMLHGKRVNYDQIKDSGGKFCNGQQLITAILISSVSSSYIIWSSNTQITNGYNQSYSNQCHMQYASYAIRIISQPTKNDRKLACIFATGCARFSILREHV